jgi:DNA-binding NarL/FixJ family response regulator
MMQINKIQIGIYDEHKLVQEGIITLLKEVTDVEVVLTADNKPELFKELNNIVIHVLLLNIHVLSTKILNLIMQVNISFPKVRMLVISVHNDEETILKTIKAGAKGFLAKDSTLNELVEAIYTLRNGHDFYSNSITHLLLNKYIAKLQNEGNETAGNIKNLSSREIEIIKLWGNSQTNKEIANKLFISVRTVESHKNHIMQKLNLKTAVDLVKFAIKNSIIEI